MIRAKGRRPDADADEQVRQARAEVAAVTDLVRATAAATSSDDVVRAALSVVRDRFGWAYGSYWRLDRDAGVLRFAQDSGRVGTEFEKVTAEAAFPEGVGLSGRAWRARDLVFVADLGEMTDCVRAPAAQRAGVRSGICFPVFRDGEVAGTMDFFSTETLTLSDDRTELLRCVGTLVSQSLERSVAEDTLRRSAQDVDAVSAVLRNVSGATDRREALARALETIRAEFHWDYGSYWQLDEQSRVLRFEQDAGDAGPEFRKVTLEASFAEGVGLSGRAWQQRDLVFAPDLGEVTDCVRAPVAQRAGVKSGVCLPIQVGGAVVGTMDFFVTRTVVLSPGRESALRNTALLVGQALERFAAADRLHTAGQELIESITEVERNVVAATTVAGEGQRLAAEADLQMTTLGTASAEISKVVQVIQGIAGQTNLLALNATIEAARAGEAGKGVKDLANETARATTEVDSKVSAIQQQVDRVSASLREITRAVEEINQTQILISGVLTQQGAVTKAILQ